jgi:hypothetical protein
MPIRQLPRPRDEIQLASIVSHLSTARSCRMAERSDSLSLGNELTIFRQRIPRRGVVTARQRGPGQTPNFKTPHISEST